MPLDVLPDELIVRDADEWTSAYLRALRFYDPDVDLRPGLQPANEAAALGVQLQVISQNARLIGQKIPLASQTLDELSQTAEEKGIPPLFPATGASGYVSILAPSGTTIFSGDELRDSDTGIRFQCIATGTYANGQSVPIAGIDVGPQTNFGAGATLQWSQPRPGCGPVATIVGQTDGTGLEGGRDGESADEFRQRISDAMANPPASGNTAQYIQLVEDSRGHGVPVQKGFAYPACLGPGTVGLAFTLKPIALTSSRVPNTTQTAQVRDFVTGQMPADDGYCEVQLLEQHVDIVLDVAWADGAAGWTDAVPWPPRYSPGGTPGAIGVTAATSASSFTLDCLNGVRTGVAQPAVGQTIALLNPATGKFSRKKLASVTGAGPWVCVADTSNAASDTAYTPVVGQRVCPWSDSLDLLVAPILKNFSTVGPGEQRAIFFDAGLREKRSPPSPKYWPYVISNRLAGDILKEQPIQDAVIREGLGTTATVGVPGATAYLIELGYITAFPSA